MKIQINDIYVNYNITLKNSKNELLEEQKSYNNSKIYLISKLEEYKHYIDNFTNIKFEDINKLDRCLSQRSLMKIVNILEINSDTLIRTINIIVQINKNLYKIENQLKELEENSIDKEMFREVLCNFNTKISNEIIYKGYVFKIGYALGVIRIKKILCDTRVKKKIDWNKSNLKRKELLLQGKIPFEVIKRGENREALEDNGGEHWFVYHDKPFDFLFHWSKNRNIILNSAYYKFKPTIYNNTSRDGGMGNINKLAQLKNIDSPLLNNYY